MFEISTAFPITIAPGTSVEINIQFNGNVADKGVYEDVITLSSDSDNERIARQIWVFAEKLTTFTSISELDINSADFNLSPNPAIGNLSIQSNSSDEKVIEIFNLSGQMIYKTSSYIEKLINLDVSELKEGIYLLVLTNKKTMFRQSKKLIIQKI